MALTEDLNIYRSMYNLTRVLIHARNAFDKSMKYVVGEDMIRRSLGCLSLIHYANEDRRKGAREEHLDKFLIEFDILKTLIMVCRDERQFKKDSILADIFMLAADVENQAGAWRRSAARNVVPTRAEPSAARAMPSASNIQSTALKPESQ